jgi:hypothetical protein
METMRRKLWHQQPAPLLRHLSDSTYPITLSDGSATNYIITNSNAVLTVTKANLIAQQIIKRGYMVIKSGVYVAYDGFLNGDGVASIAIKPIAGTTANLLSPAGFYQSR